MPRQGVAFAVLAVIAALLACASPLTTPTLQPVGTGVALTLQAIASAAPPSARLPSARSLTIPTPAYLLPHALYFLRDDEAGLSQVFRLDPDGQTVHQITFEPLKVNSFDVSPKDGSIAYSSNNQLFVVDESGAGRRMLVDGGPVDEDNRWTNSLGAPVWSPDGQTLAYSHGGLSLLDPSTDISRRVLQNKVDTSPGFPVVHETYAPNAYSPDGTRLLINIGFYEGGTYGIFDLSNQTLLRLQRSDNGTICCHAKWIPDGTGVYIASPSLGMIESGLFYAEAGTGNVSALLPATPGDGTYNFADAAQVGPDGQLYFFFNNLPEIPAGTHTPLYMVRSASDGMTDRVRLVPQAFEAVNEILWAPDASLAILVVAAEPGTYEGGAMMVVYPGGRPAVSLVPFAHSLRWAP